MITIGQAVSVRQHAVSFWGTRRPRARLLLATLCGVGALLCCAASAYAGGPHVFEGSFGGPCTGAGNACEPGQLAEPSGVAVDEESGDVYIADRGSDRVVKYNSTGSAVLAEFDGSAAPSGALEEPEGIAVDNSGNPADPSEHDVYVTDPGHKAVDKFSPAGVFEGQLTEAKGTPFHEVDGVAVDSAGTLWIYVRNPSGDGETDSFSDAQENELLSSSETPYGVNPGFAVDSEDNLYVHRGGGFPFAKLNVADQLLVAAVNEGPASAAAVDLATNVVYVDELTAIRAFGATPGCTVASHCETMPSESLIETFGEGHITAGRGIGVNSASNTVYVADAHADDVSMFVGPVPPPPPAVTLGAVTELQGNGAATLNGSVNPRGFAVTQCEFEYATAEELAVETTYRHSAPCSTPHTVSQADPLTGEAPIAVSTKISGLPLRPGEVVVYYRLKALSANGSSLTSPQTYRTGPFQSPLIGAAPAADVTQSTATLKATIDTDLALVDYHFEYGLSTAYGSVAPIPDAYTPITPETLTVSQSLSGLAAGTTYHYRLVASSPGATNITGPDETFTTLAIPAPGVQTGGTSAVGVGAATLSGSVDPHGWDTSYEFQYGTTTAYGAAWPTVEVDLGALEGAQSVVVSIPNLLPDTTYHYRLVATNGGGVSYGSDMTFTTAEYPAAIVQEPSSLRTLVVPGEGATKKATVKKKGKRKKATRRKKGRRRSKAKR